MENSQTHVTVWTWMAGFFGASLVALLGWISRERLKEVLKELEDVKSEVKTLRDHMNVRIDALRSDLSDIKARVSVIEDRLNRLVVGKNHDP